MERINGSEWVWNIVNTYDSEVRNISDRLSFEKMLLWVNTRGMVMNKEIRSDKRIKNIIGIIQLSDIDINISHCFYDNTD